MVESQPSKLLVAGSIPVSRSRLRSLPRASRWQASGVALGQGGARDSAADGARRRTRQAGLIELESERRPCRWEWRSGTQADVAQLAERVLGKDEVTSSILVIGSSLRSHERRSPSLRTASEVQRSDQARPAEGAMADE